MVSEIVASDPNTRNRKQLPKSLTPAFGWSGRIVAVVEIPSWDQIVIWVRTSALVSCALHKFFQCPRCRLIEGDETFPTLAFCASPRNQDFRWLKANIL